MDFSKILPAINSVAPVIAGLLGGPLASMGVQALEGVFGLTPGKGASDPAALTAAVAGMTPETAIKLAQIDADLKAKLVQAGIDYETISAGDRNSARQMRTASKDPTSSIVGILILIIWGYVNISLLQAEHPPVVGDMVVGRILGMIDAATLAFLYFLYGSSVSSKTKDETISKLSS